MPTYTTLTMEQRVAALERQNGDLKKQVQTLKNSNFMRLPQQSAIAGELIAGRLRGNAAPNQRGMVLDFGLSGLGSGVAPVLTVSDGAYNRWQEGDLAAYTGPNGVSSPAQIGARMMDANGNLMFDSIGYSQSAKLLANLARQGIFTLANTNGPTDYTVMSTTFTVTNRTTNVRLDSMLTALSSTSSGILITGLNVSCQVVGQAKAPAVAIPIYINNGSGNFASANTFQFLTLPPGAYTFNLIWSSVFNANTETLTWYSGALSVLQLGA